MNDIQKNEIVNKYSKNNQENLNNVNYNLMLNKREFKLKPRINKDNYSPIKPGQILKNSNKNN